MADAKSEVSHAVEEHGRAIDALHQKLSSIAGCDKAKLAAAVAKLKAAHKTFADDAQACIGF
ncbi:MAG TPA: hypothetical protein VKR05_05735 [Candidatus Cybelea sp.]|nr:hypothetical protein [Candidatus Cybelea sp.]